LVIGILLLLNRAIMHECRRIALTTVRHNRSR
jgi:hypothetical protein